MKRMKRPWKLSCQKHPKCNAHLLILLQKNWQKSRQKFGLICRVGRFCWWIHEEVTEVISCLQIYHRFSGNAKKKNSNIYKDTLLSTKAINSIGICFFLMLFRWCQCSIARLGWKTGTVFPDSWWNSIQVPKWEITQNF